MLLRARCGAQVFPGLAEQAFADAPATKPHGGSFGSSGSLGGGLEPHLQAGGGSGGFGGGGSGASFGSSSSSERTGVGKRAPSGDKTAKRGAKGRASRSTEAGKRKPPTGGTFNIGR